MHHVWALVSPCNKMTVMSFTECLSNTRTTVMARCCRPDRCTHVQCCLAAIGHCYVSPETHDDVIKWKYFPRYWPFVREIHRSQRIVTRGFYVIFDLRPNKRLSKQSRGWWFETLSHPIWRHSNEWNVFDTSVIANSARILDHCDKIALSFRVNSEVVTPNVVYSNSLNQTHTIRHTWIELTDTEPSRSVCAPNSIPAVDNA